MATIKDSGARVQFDSGMQRDVDTDKTKWHLVASGPMLHRWAQHLTGGAKKYDDDNWMKANGPAELARFRASAMRHFMQWYYGDKDEDHAAAVYFNINGAEYVKGRMPVPGSITMVDSEAAQPSTEVDWLDERIRMRRASEGRL